MTTEPVSSVDINNLGDLVLDKMQRQDFRHPLKDFEGNLVDVKGEYRESKTTKRTNLWLKLSFTDIKVNACHEGQTYPHPVAELEIMHSTGSSSAYAVLATSIAEVFGRPVKFNEIMKSKLHMKYTDKHPTQRRDEKTNQWVDAEMSCWEVVEINGKGKEAGAMASSSQPLTATQAIDLAHGKSVKDFGKALLTTPGLPDSVRQIAMDNNEETFLDGLVKAGLMRKDHGIYYKVV